MKGAMWVVAGVVGLSGAAEAGPLRASRVAPDAQWVVHVDMERLSSSALGTFIRENESIALDLDEIHGIRHELGLDPFTDIRSVTLSGIDPENEHPMIVLEASSALDNALARLPEAAGEKYHKVENAGRTVHVLEDDGQTWYAYVKQGADAGSRVLFVASSMDELTEGMVRLEVARDAVMPPAVRHGGPDVGSFVYLSVNDLPHEMDDMGPASMLLKNATSVTVDLGEAGGDLFVRGLIDSVDPAQAQNIVQMAQGLLAMGKAMAPNDPDAARFVPILDSVRIGMDGGSLALSLRAPVALVKEIIAEEHGGAIEEAHAARLEGLRQVERHKGQISEAEKAAVKARIEAEVAARVTKEIEEEIQRRVREEVERELRERGIERR